MSKLFRSWLSKSVEFDYNIGVVPESVQKLFEMPVWMRPELQGSEEEQYFKSKGYKPLDQAKFGPYAGKPVWWNPKEKGLTYPQGGGIPGQPQQQAQGGQPQPQPQPQQQQQPQQQPQKDNLVTSWILARAKVSDPNLNIKAGQTLGVSQQDKNNWKFVSFDLDDGLLMDLGTIPVQNISNVIERIPDESGRPISASKPSELLKKAMPVKDKKISGIIPEDKMTEEGRAIEKRFEQMISGDGSNHMVIGALAGTGKTTMLRHLAEKYGKAGQSWLYIVFNKKNEMEAQGSFPKFVKVRTSNGFAGDILDANKIKPTERVIKYSKSEKARLVVDGPQFQEVMQALKIPNPDKIPSEYNSGTMLGFIKSIQYSFKRSALSLLSLTKAYAVDPRQPNALNKAIEEVLSKHDVDMNLDHVKERLEKHPQSEYYNEAISQMMGVSNFLERSFTDEVKKATKWLLEKTQPHGIDQDFQSEKRGRGSQPGETKNLKGMRDFEDDTWYLALHANEIDWTKPQKWDVVLVDETQDFNRARQIIVGKLADTGAKVVVVGDPNQAIYRFIGADDQAFERLTSDLEERSEDKTGTLQSLSYNFRSRKEVLDFVNQKTIMKELAEKGKGLKPGRNYSVEGNVTDKEMEYQDAMSTLEEEQEHMGEIKTTAFISPINQSLTKVALDLMSKNISFILLGKDLAKDLTQHIDQITRMYQLWDNNDLEELTEALSKHLNDKQEKWGTSASKAGNLKELRETTDALLAAAEKMDPNATIKDFKRWLWERLGGVDTDKMNKRELAEFKKKIEEQNPVVLTTAHKSKGLEFERVYIVNDNLFQSPKRQRPEDKAEGERLRYVAYTRAEKELHILDTEEKEKNK